MSALPNPDKVFDELLVLQYNAGDSKALELLVRRWHKKMVMYIYRNTQDMEMAKDIAQEVWMVALKNTHQLKDTRKFGSWVLAIAHYKCLDSVNQKRKTEKVVSVNSLHPSTSIENESQQLLKMHEAMQDLSLEHRNILSLFYLEGFTITDIAHILQLSKGTIKSRLFYARESLKKKIKNL